MDLLWAAEAEGGALATNWTAWETFAPAYFPTDGSFSLVTRELPAAAHSKGTRFKFVQAVFVARRDHFAIDDFVVRLVMKRTPTSCTLCSTHHSSRCPFSLSLSLPSLPSRNRRHSQAEALASGGPRKRTERVTSPGSGDWLSVWGVAPQSGVAQV